MCGPLLGYFRIDYLFDTVEFGGRQRLEVGEVEPQSVRRHERAGLADVFSEDFSQRVIQKMGGGMIDGRFLSLFPFDGCFYPIAGFYLAFFNAPTGLLLRRSISSISIFIAS